MSRMSDIEFEAWCGSCNNHWYLRLRGITDPAPIVRCPRCGSDGRANRIGWEGDFDPDQPSPFAADWRAPLQAEFTPRERMEIRLRLDLAAPRGTEQPMNLKGDE